MVKDHCDLGQKDAEKKRLEKLGCGIRGGV